MRRNGTPLTVILGRNVPWQEVFRLGRSRREHIPKLSQPGV